MRVTVSSLHARAPRRSFRQAWGSNAPLYATDVVYAATALLEAPAHVRPGESAPREDKADQFWCARALSACAPPLTCLGSAAGEQKWLARPGSLARGLRGATAQLLLIRQRAI